MDTDATIYYDLQGRLIIGVHSVTQNDIHVNGMKATATLDLNLKDEACSTATSDQQLDCHAELFSH